MSTGTSWSIRYWNDLAELLLSLHWKTLYGHAILSTWIKGCSSVVSIQSHLDTSRFDTNKSRSDTSTTSIQYLLKVLKLLFSDSWTVGNILIYPSLVFIEVTELVSKGLCTCIKSTFRFIKPTSVFIETSLYRNDRTPWVSQTDPLASN